MEEKKQGDLHEHSHHEHTHHAAEHHKKTFFIKQNLEYMLIGLAVLLAVIIIFNIFVSFNLSKNLKKNAEIAKEQARPGKIELTVIGNSKCEDCFDITPYVSYVKTQNVNVTSEKALEFGTAEAKALITKYKIDKIPQIVITGEIDKVSIEGFSKQENALLLSQVIPPYTNVTNGNVIGRVKVYNLKDASCSKCNDLSILMSQLESGGVKIAEQKNVTIDSAEGKELIKKYNIGFAPTLILSKDASAYELIQKYWLQIGSQENDGLYVLRIGYPPFVNLTNGKLMGMVNIIYLTDKSCTDCYNVSTHRTILASPQSFALQLDKEETFDIADSKGKELLLKYNITQVPTVILSEDAGVYPSSQELQQFFSVEKDGSFIFRELGAVGGAYKDLTTNQVVKPQQVQQ